MIKKNLIGRRRFLKASSLGLIGSGMSLGSASPRTLINLSLLGESKPFRIKEYRNLGRTDFRVSDLASGSVYDEGLLGAMLDAGVNYIDTAESYPGHHKIVSQAIKGRERKSIFITSKMEVKDDTSKEGFLKRARKCLDELKTDYIDCMMMHMPEKKEILKTEGFHSAMAELKAEGRIRFVGVSHHGSFWFKDPEESMENVLLAAAEDGRFDVFLLAYNFLQLDMAERVLEVCREKKIGTALMKTAPVGKYYLLKSRIEELDKERKDVHPLFREGLGRYREKAEKAENFIRKYDLKNVDEINGASIKFVLNNPNVNTVCCSLQNFEDLERVLKLSGERLDSEGEEKLEAYREGCGMLYCRHACGVCEPHCPRGVPVNTIMRYFHYYLAQGRVKEAILKYARIEGNRADSCRECQGFCEPACPYNVPIQGLLILANEELSLA